MLLGYNTNGLAHHSLPAALELLAGHGYESVAITLDCHCLNPFAADHAAELSRVAELLAQHKLQSVIETGARFLLDPRRKHHPTLLAARAGDRRRRVEFLCRAIDVAASLGSGCVSLWSGAPDDDPEEQVAWNRLCEGLGSVLEYAEQVGVDVGFEPEPGMFVARMDRYAELLARLDSPRLRLTLDVGHLHCQGETPIAAAIRQWSDRLVNVHIEDMRAGVHEHLRFGEGEMEFPPIIAALAEVGYTGPLHVELSRHSHEAPAAVAHAAAFLRPLVS